MEAVRIFWCALSLSSFSLSSMEIEERSQLLSERDLEAQRESYQKDSSARSCTHQSYLNLLNADIAFELAQHVDGDSPGLSLLLEKVSITENQSDALYKKMLKAYASPAPVLQMIEIIKNEQTREKLKAAAQRYQNVATDITQNLRRNKTRKIKHYLETELGSLEYLRSITASSRNTQDFERIRKELKYYNQIVNNLKNDCDNFESRKKCGESLTGSGVIGRGFLGASLLTCAVLAGYSLANTISSFPFVPCLNEQNNICFYNTTNPCHLHQNKARCCNAETITLCSQLQQQYNVAHSPVKVWAPFIIVTTVLVTLNILLHMIVRTCIRQPALSPRIKTLVKNYAEEVARLKMVVRNVSGSEQP